MYVEGLARLQRLEGIDAAVAAPGRRGESYGHGGIKVWRFPVAQEIRNLRELYGEADVVAANAFAAILENEQPDLVHLHAFTRGVSLPLAREARRRRMPVVFSYHTPTVSCQRGTLLRWGSEACDGVLNGTVCSACTLHGLGLSKRLGTATASLPKGVGRLVAAAGLSGGVWTALRMTELVTLRHATLRELWNEVDHVVALCGWVKDLLRRNGVPEEKITVSRQGLCQSRLATPPPPRRTRGNGPRVRCVFFGRLEPAKGAHLLIDALKAAPDLPMSLDLYGVIQGDASVAYRRSLKEAARTDPRITFRSALPSGEVIARMRDYDVLAVPSLGLETGPMVALEAFAAGLPVIGSNLGGIQELVTHEVDGLLVEPGSVPAWTAVLRRLVEESELLGELRRGIRLPRRMEDCARDLHALYRRLAPACAYA